MLNKIKNSKLDNEKLKKCQLVNNDKLEGFDFSKVIVKKPWGHEYVAYNEGTATSMHCHPNKKTAVILLSGQVVTSTLNNDFSLNEGDGLVLDKKVFHSHKAISDQTILMEVETPPIKTDLVRLSDRYGRESKGYEQQNEMCFDFEKYQPILFNKLEEKKIGKMRVGVEDFQDNSSFCDNLKLSGNTTILLLSGEMFDKKNKERFSVGDIFEINNPEEINNIKIKKPVKILKIVKKQIKAILFDFDGVLADTMEDNFLAWEKTFKDFGIKIQRGDYFPLEGLKLMEVAKKISDKYKIYPNLKTVAELKNKYYLKNHSLSFYPGVIKLINSLKRNKCLLAIVSASPREKLNKTVPKEFLEKFDAIISEEDSINGKPAPDPYLNAAKKLEISPAECLVIENAPLGIKSAKKAGMYCIAICSTVDKTFLSEADEIIDEFEGLEKLETITSLI